MGSTERTRLAIRGAVTGAVLFVLCVVQTTVFGRWKLFGAVPDLMLCAVVLIGYCRGREAGAIAGIAGGAMLAMLGSVGITVEPVFYMVVGGLSRHSAPVRRGADGDSGVPDALQSPPGNAVCLRRPPGARRHCNHGTGTVLPPPFSGRKSK